MSQTYLELFSHIFCNLEKVSVSTNYYSVEGKEKIPSALNQKILEFLEEEVIVGKTTGIRVIERTHLENNIRNLYMGYYNLRLGQKTRLPPAVRAYLSHYMRDWMLVKVTFQDKSEAQFIALADRIKD